MKIKNLNILGKTFLAPLAGITNLPFRMLIKECGCAVVCSEMISAKGLFYNSQKTVALMVAQKEERPFSLQIFGNDPNSMARAAQFVEEMGTADILDINFGCSVKKVIKQGAGAALMKEPGLARQILTAVRSATTLPITIKIRSGWEPSGQQACRIAGIAQDCGVNAVAVHPRTAVQLFKGTADWNIIRQVKKTIDIPVIGNGDILCPEDAGRMIGETGCDAVMVGRAAMKNPYILSQIEDYLEKKEYFRPTPSAILIKMKELTVKYAEHFPDHVACKMLRGRLTWFVKGWPNSSSFRKRLSTIESVDQALDLIASFENSMCE